MNTERKYWGYSQPVDLAGESFSEVRLMLYESELYVPELKWMAQYITKRRDLTGEEKRELRCIVAKQLEDNVRWLVAPLFRLNEYIGTSLTLDDVSWVDIPACKEIRELLIHPCNEAIFSDEIMNIDKTPQNERPLSVYMTRHAYNRIAVGQRIVDLSEFFFSQFVIQREYCLVLCQGFRHWYSKICEIASNFGYTLFVYLKDSYHYLLFRKSGHGVLAGTEGRGYFASIDGDDITVREVPSQIMKESSLNFVLQLENMRGKGTMKWKPYESEIHEELCEEPYYCVDWQKEGNFKRSLGGDPMMKSSVVYIRGQKLGGFEPCCESPAIIVDKDRRKAIAFVVDEKQGYRGEKFLLDDHFRAYTLDGSFLSGDSLRRRYGDVANKINQNLDDFCLSLEGVLSKTPGKPYHLSDAEVNHILDSHIDAVYFWTKRGKKRLGTQPVVIGRPDEGTAPSLNVMNLAPCDYDLRPYLKRLVSDGYVREELNDNGRVIRYPKSHDKTAKSLVLFAFIMNARISEHYERMDDSYKRGWLAWYDLNGWEGDDFPRAIRSNKGSEWRTRQRTVTYRHFETKGICDAEIEVNETRDLRKRYFAKLFSMREEEFRSLKSNATAPDLVNVFNPNGELQGIIKLIGEVDSELQKTSLKK